MTMTHKEALAKAIEAFYTEVDNLDGSDMEAAIRAYLDARGLVMVPMDGCDEMREAASKRQGESDYAALRWESPDDEVFSVVLAAIAAAPDPFGDE